MFSDLAMAQAHIICEYGVSSEKGETTWRLISRTKIPILCLPPGGIDVAMIDQEVAAAEVVSS